MVFLARLALILVFILIILKIIKRFIKINFNIQVYNHPGMGQPPGGRSPGNAEEMVRDPVCGAYISAARAERVNVGASTVFFCSRKCLEEYRRKLAG